MSRQDETYYELLKVPPTASVTEIITAYHAAKNAYSKDSLATYSLFSTDDIKFELDRLEEAYSILTNSSRRLEYDRGLAAQVFTAIQADSKVGMSPTRVPELVESVGSQTAEASSDATPIAAAAMPDTISGNFLRETRERRGLTLEDVSKTTKIPMRYLQAIEGDEPNRLPARVYLQGFLKNLAALYRLEPNVISRSYLTYQDNRSK